VSTKSGLRVKSRKSKLGPLVPRPSSLGTLRGPGYDEALAAARYIQSHGALSPRVGVIVGSGLGELVGRIENARRIPYSSIPHFPRSTVAGHTGELVMGTWGGQTAAMLSGRVHLYEGYNAAEIVLPVRALALAGIEILLITCAAGGISRQCTPGSLMVFSDHLNYQAVNPLTGPEDQRLGPRFIDMTEAYDRELRSLAVRAARRLRLKCSEGVYAALPGPSFETPAEIRALRALGADAVGMSTVPEVIAARQRGVRVLAVASITNRAAGLSRQHLSHQEVLEAGRQGARDLPRLFDTVVSHIR
jgi:purine-nucleoside phosphorylase